MDQATARERVQQGAVLLVHDLPVGSEFGMDYKAWQTGPQFRGAKMIPEGIHYVYYSSSQRSATVMTSQTPRVGFFIQTKPGDVLIFKWNAHNELLEDTRPSEEEVQNVRQNYQEIDRYLGAYPMDGTFKTWLSLSSHITPACLRRITPACGYITSATAMEGTSGLVSSRQSKADADKDGSGDKESVFARDKDAWQSMQPVPEARLGFVSIPRRLVPAGATPQEISQHSMDRSYTLTTLIAQQFDNDPKEAIAEMQAAFVCFLIGQVYDAFEQWKQWVHLLCHCDDALAQFPQLFLDFMSTLSSVIERVCLYSFCACLHAPWNKAFTLSHPYLANHHTFQLPYTII
eukprot:TRINITY_DN11798_c0_g1_i4.p1 TRINITY_DN11798_c0_g1~~TRINITY_DN11798_c0_g1_i4.p1  ORF type:complete len:346 (+),score=43.44 TRINITY_DN11798_c0_g1_i4:85-1122(+)